jgi:tetratricopeptide (TPR) repeat protein
MYFYAGEFDKAREFYLKALAISPEDYRYWGSLADSLESLGSQAEAVEAYGRAIQAARTQLGINAQDHKARASLAHFLARTGEAERARVEIEQAVAAAAGDMDVRYNEALVMVDLGLQEAAVAAVRAALEAGYQPALLAADPGLAPLQANAEFTRLTQRP